MVPWVRPPRLVTAAALFDGHDAAINLVRRLLVDQGAQVIHLGHNRSVDEVVKAALEEDADAVCISSYQGGHVDYFRYLVDQLRDSGAAHIKVFGGGGGVILPEELAQLHAHGVTRLYTPEDGLSLGIQGMIADLLARIPPRVSEPGELVPSWDQRPQLAEILTAVLAGTERTAPEREPRPILGFTGTGGAGKSSLVDEVARRLLLDHPSLRLGVLAIDPTRKRSGGALLGDRLRMNTASQDRLFFRSVAGGGTDLAVRVRRAAGWLRAAGADLVLVETSGIGQGDTDILDMSDLPIYVMTREFGAGTQLEKINMLDYAACVVLNKFEDKQAEDALKAVRRQFRRSRNLGPEVADTALPVYGTAASRFNDAGVDRFYLDLIQRLRPALPIDSQLSDPGSAAFDSSRTAPIIPLERQSYLQDIVQTVRAYHAQTEHLSGVAQRLEALETVRSMIDASGAASLEALNQAIPESDRQEVSKILTCWRSLCHAYEGTTFTYRVRSSEVSVPLVSESLSGLPIRKVSLPRTKAWSEAARYLREENVPGSFPFTAGVFPFRRTDELPKRQFAGEGGPSRTNKRFHFLCEGDTAARLSVAFDSVTLYGEDPAERPDIFGKIGESGVSIATLDDMKALFQGFDLCAPNTSVSMTINGPAPIILAMFFNTAIDQQMARWRDMHGRMPSPEEAEALRARTLEQVRGTVQADILKEDQAQNTCIFSIEFALRMMGDVQAYLIQHQMKNYYSVSISGYHIAEAGANPISQLAFTLANGFTLVEYYLSRGMSIDAIAPNLSFFFSSGLDPEYSVMGRVARRIWAIALRDRYGASERSQKLKYHVQTSGRSLHLKEMKFNDIRTTLQALTALTDNCNSLHTNAYDEALTTPTEESVRLAMAIQLILTQEFGLYRNENLWQGSHFLEQLTDQVEQAVLDEFMNLNARGGVLRAMEGQYQRLRIQEESLHYEVKKHSGELPIVGVNTYTRPEPEVLAAPVTRASDEEKRQRLSDLAAFQSRHAQDAPAALERLRDAIRRQENIFTVLMDTVRVASLGQITAVLYDMGGRYRRAM